MTTILSPVAKQSFLDNNGRPLVGGKLFVYEAGTTIKATTYTDSTGGTPNTKPIILDYRGECNLWVDPNVGYKYTLAPANDTDPPGNPIWTVDNIFDGQLLTLYGGVDTGAANTYVLTFSASFTSYTDGIVLYWIPANTNTGASTLNVNGLGPIPIVDQSGDPLVAGAIIAGSVVQVLYVGGEFLLVSNGALGNAGPVLTGSFTPTWDGFSVAPTGDIEWTRLGPLAILYVPLNLLGTSDAVSMRIMNLPAQIRPVATALGNAIASCVAIDNGADVLAAVGVDAFLTELIFWTNSPLSQGGWTAAGSKGLRAGTTIMYAMP